MLNELFILSKIKEGDIKVFEDVFRRYYSPLCWYAASITGEMDAAEEIVEELFYVLWKDREKLNIFHSIKSYLYGAVRNQSFQYCGHAEVKGRYRDSVIASGSESSAYGPQEEMEYQELQRVINTFLKNLPERRRHIFRMHRMEGKKYSEIATELSVSVKTVEAEMTKVLKTLRIEIENYTYKR